MKQFRYLTCFAIIAGCLLFLGTCFGAESNHPIVSMRVYGERKLVQDKSAPLFLQVSIANPLAGNIQMENLAKQNREDILRKAGMLKNLSPDQLKNSEGTEEQAVPTLSLGAEGHSIGELVSFSLKGANSQTVALKAHRLRAVKNTIGPVQLSGNNPIFLMFAVDSQELKNLPDGDYDVLVRLDTTSSAGMWKGQASDTVKVSLKDGLESLPREAQESRISQEGKCYLLDGKLEDAQRCADRLLTLNKESIDAASLQGDIHFSRGENDKARKAYAEGIARYARKHASDTNPLQEPPAYLYERLRDLSVRIRN